MTWVDTHCHLQLDSRPFAELLGRAPEVELVVVPGVDLASSQAAADLAGTDPGRLVYTAGLHPHAAERWPEEGRAIGELAASAAAVGETGLDYYRDLAPRTVQRQAFRAQIDLAVDLGKPLVVHCRDAFSDVFDLVEGAGVGPRTVLHCWTGGRRWAARFLDLGVTFSFAGPIAFETGATVRQAAAVVPPGRAVVETDTPYLSPPPYRGQLNEPAWVALNGMALAEVWGMGPDEVAATTTATARRIFG